MREHVCLITAALRDTNRSSQRRNEARVQARSSRSGPLNAAVNPPRAHAQHDTALFRTGRGCTHRRCRRFCHVPEAHGARSGGLADAAGASGQGPLLALIRNDIRKYCKNRRGARHVAVADAYHRVRRVYSVRTYSVRTGAVLVPRAHRRSPVMSLADSRAELRNAAGSAGTSVILTSVRCNV